MRSRKFSHLLIGLSLCLSLVLPFSASAIGIEPTLPDPVKEQRARELFKELRCMVCQNQSIDDSNADLARDLRVVVRERIAAGDSDEQAKEYLVERYGDWVLLNPPVKAETALLWSSPFILLAIAFSVGFFYLRRAKNAPEVEQSLAAEEKHELRKLMADWQKKSEGAKSMTWIAIIILTLVVVMAIVRPLLRPATDHVEGGDLALYRDQLAELDRDVLRGLISAEEAKSARFELEKRLLKAAKDGKGPATWQLEKPLAWLLAVVVAGGSWMLYDWRGSPMLPDFPLLARQVGTAVPGQSSQPASTSDHAENPQASMAEAAERLAQKLALNPEDFDGWALLGRTYLTLNRASDAALAYREAVRLNPTNPEVQAGLGEALTFANNGQVNELAKKAFELAYSFDPKNSASLYYLGMAHAQSGQIEKAVDYWQKLAAQTEPGASWAVELREKLTQAANQLGKNPADLIPANLVAAADASAVPPAAAIPGPTPEQMAAAQDMDPEARNQMIQGMVQRLADKLAANPNDAEGWQRLSRAYAVLGQSEKAAEAQSNALKYGASAGAGTGTPSNPNIKGPTAEQMAAASQMSEADQRAMIDGMVKKLETRLQQQPGDFEGWIRLGQSYRVLGRSEDARKAWEKAKALKPNDPAVNNLLKQLGNG